MNKVARPRFGSAEAALRFYFRARDILGGPDESALKVPVRIPHGIAYPDQTIWDFAAVGSSLVKLGEFENWLICELFGPTCFRPRDRTIDRALYAARIRFPGRRISRRKIERVRRDVLIFVRRRLALNGLIAPAAGGRRAGPRRAARMTEAPAHAAEAPH